MTNFLSKMTPLGWNPGIGDPTPIGWITVAFYLLASTLCFLQWKREKSQNLKHSSHFALLSALLLLLGVNKQLDLQTALTQLARIILPAIGWEQYKRPIQLAFLLSIAALALLLVLALGHRVLKSAPRHLTSFVGLNLLIAFILIRAASFHHIDRLLGQEIGFLKLNHTLEIGALLLIILGTQISKYYSRNLLPL